MFDRRAMLAGLGAAGLATPAWPARKDKEKKELPPEAPLFTSGVLSRNAIGRAFTIPAKPLVWPAKTHLLNDQGKTATLQSMYGKLLLVDMWAEWCTPCLRELAGVAYQKVKGTTPNFDVIAICTGTNVFEKPSQAKPLLDKIGAPGLATWLDIAEEPRRLIDTVCVDPKTGDYAVPCMLLIDKTGQVRGHVVGGFDVIVEQGPGKGQEINAWSTTVSTEFMRELASGELPIA